MPPLSTIEALADPGGQHHLGTAAERNGRADRIAARHGRRRPLPAVAAHPAAKGNPGQARPAPPRLFGVRLYEPIDVRPQSIVDVFSSLAQIDLHLMAALVRKLPEPL